MKNKINSNSKLDIKMLIFILIRFSMFCFDFRVITCKIFCLI